MRGKIVIYRPTRQLVLVAALLLVVTMAGCVRARDIAPPAAGHPAAADSMSVAFTQPASPFANPIEPLAEHAMDAQEVQGMPGMDHGAEIDRGLTVYTCPMHADVRSDRPGACPVCGMNLVPNSPVGGHQHGGKP
jgi:uncharacterized protein involved in copper resistance